MPIMVIKITEGTLLRFKSKEVGKAGIIEVRLPSRKINNR
jgi:hypothetical protein